MSIPQGGRVPTGSRSEGKGSVSSESVPQTENTNAIKVSSGLRGTPSTLTGSSSSSSSFTKSFMTRAREFFDLSRSSSSSEAAGKGSAPVHDGYTALAGGDGITSVDIESKAGSAKPKKAADQSEWVVPASEDVDAPEKSEIIWHPETRMDSKADPATGPAEAEKVLLSLYGLKDTSPEFFVKHINHLTIGRASLSQVIDSLLREKTTVPAHEEFLCKLLWQLCRSHANHLSLEHAEKVMDRISDSEMLSGEFKLDAFRDLISSCQHSGVNQYTRQFASGLVSRILSAPDGVMNDTTKAGLLVKVCRFAGFSTNEAIALCQQINNEKPGALSAAGRSRAMEEVIIEKGQSFFSKAISATTYVETGSTRPRTSYGMRYGSSTPGKLFNFVKQILAVPEDQLSDGIKTTLVQGAIRDWSISGDYVEMGSRSEHWEHMSRDQVLQLQNLVRSELGRKDLIVPTGRFS